MKETDFIEDGNNPGFNYPAYMQAYEILPTPLIIINSIFDEKKNFVDGKIQFINSAFQRAFKLTDTAAEKQALLQALPNIEHLLFKFFSEKPSKSTETAYNYQQLKTNRQFLVYGRQLPFTENAHCFVFHEKVSEIPSSPLSLSQNSEADFDPISESLHESNNRYRSLFENATVGIFRSSSAGKILAVNPALAHMLDFESPDEAVRYYTDIGEQLYLKPEKRKQFLQLLLTRGKVENFEYGASTVKGRKIWLNVNAHIKKNDNKHGSIIQGFVSDRTKNVLSGKALEESEAFLNAVLESIQDGISVLNPDLSIRYTNKVMKDWYNESLPLERKKCYATYHGISEPCSPCPAVRCIESGKVERDIVSGAPYPESPVKWIELFCYPIFNNESGEVSGVVEFVRDITEQRETQKTFQDIFNNSCVAIYIQDRQGRFLDVNKAAAELYGYERKNLIGKTPEFISAPGQNDLDRIAEHIQKTFEGEIQQFEFTAKRKNGSFFPKIVTTEKASYFGKDVIFAYAVDITKRKKAEDALKANEKKLKKQNAEYEALNEELTKINEELSVAKEAAEESNRLKTAFLQNMSHEIRTPMNGILGFSQLIESADTKPEEYRHYAKIIAKSSNQLLSIINNILLISSLDAKKETVDMKVCNINEIIADVSEIFRIEAAKKGLEFKWELLENSKDAFVKTDAVKLTQILTNLINNSLKFTDKGYVSLTCELKKNSRNNTPEVYLFCVKDTGIGIRKELKKKIFDRFDQGRDEIGKKYGGTGLGLSISKAFADLLGAKLWVESEPGKGSAFYLALPFNEIQP